MLGVRELYTSLNQHGYICDPPFVAKVAACLNTTPQAGAFLFGSSGTGKTLLPEVLSKALDAALVFQQCFPGTREEDLMVRMVPDENTKSGIRSVDGVIPEAMRLLAETDGMVVLALDEWDKTRPSADAFLLDFLQSGRVRYAGRSIALTPEQQGRLKVFVTMNDERDLSEVLLRRLPKIDFSLLPSNVVRSALIRSHGNHPLIEGCVTLYRRCYAAGLQKPCTIQELRQLIDAVTFLGRYADWDTLVYQYVTKTPEQHTLLIAAERVALPNEQERRPELGIAAYGMAELPPVVGWRQPKLPSLADARNLDLVQAAAGDIDTGAAGGIVVSSETAYDAMLDFAGAPQADPVFIGGVAKVVGDAIVISRTFELAVHGEMAKLWGEVGEVAFVASEATFDEVMVLRQMGWKVVSYAVGRLVAKDQSGLILSWRHGFGVEMIVDLGGKTAFDTFLRTACPEAWLVVKMQVAVKKIARRRLAS